MCQYDLRSRRGGNVDFSCRIHPRQIDRVRHGRRLPLDGWHSNEVLGVMTPSYGGSRAIDLQLVTPAETPSNRKRPEASVTVVCPAALMVTPCRGLP